MEGDGTIKSPSGPWQSGEECVLSDHFSHGWCPGEPTVVGVKNLFQIPVLPISASQLPLLSN